MKRVPIGQLLIQGGSIDTRQLRAGLEWQKRRGGRLGHALVHLGLVNETELLWALGRQFEIPIVDLTARNVPADVLLLVPQKIIEGRRVLPLELLSECRRGPLLVATSDPLDLQALDEVAFASGKLVRSVLATKTQLEVAIARYMGRRHPSALDMPPEPLEEMDLVQGGRLTRFWN
jgi:type IV pilus assembly protein PilB